MEETVGKVWNRLITHATARDYPEARVELTEVEKLVGVFFRALGGDAGLRVAAATQQTHGARRRFLERVAGSNERHTPARLDQQTLRLPPSLAVFPEKNLNRDLYLWLAALAACDVSPQRGALIRNQHATMAALARFPGLRVRYQKLLAATLAARPAPEDLPEEERVQESVIRQALEQPGSVGGLPPLSSYKARRPQPVLLWLEDNPAGPASGSSPQTAASGEEQLPPEGSGTEGESRTAHRAERVDEPDNESPFLMIFRAESLFSWAEYVRLNRKTDDDDDPHAEEAARDMDKLSIARDGKTGVSKVKFDLDLPSAAEDDSPLGPGILLPEWDYRKQVMQPDYVRLQPLIASEAPAAPLPESLKKTAHRMRQQFAALVPQRRWLKAQPDGSEIDLDAWVRSLADRRTGQTPDSNTYLAQARCERDLSCLVLADLSLSTDAWISDEQRIIDVIRDSLLLFAEAMSATGDAFGIYGFSSLRRNNVRFHLFKDFGHVYDAEARGRILALKPGYYTRMGAALRQASLILAEQASARRVLLLISDGKPNDLDRYDSRYGIEDTRMAIIEARKMGLQPFCVTIDREAGSYLPHLFGPAGFIVIKKPEDLPQRLPLLYAQLTRQ